MSVLDTNVIAALMDIRHNKVVANWLDDQPTTSIWTNSISVFELCYGIDRLPEGCRRDAQAFATVVRVGLGHRVLSFGEPEAEEATALMARRYAPGRPAGGNDDMIAGTVRVNRATLATRNVRHFEYMGIAVVDPWTA